MSKRLTHYGIPIINPNQSKVALAKYKNYLTKQGISINKIWNTYVISGINFKKSEVTVAKYK